MQDPIVNEKSNGVPGTGVVVNDNISCGYPSMMGWNTYLVSEIRPDKRNFEIKSADSSKLSWWARCTD